MNFIHAAKSGFIKYVDFKGRASRSEYWYFVLALGLIGILIALVEIYTGMVDSIDSKMVSAEVNTLGVENEMMIFPVNIFPCNISEGDSFYISYENGLPKVDCGSPE